MYLSQKLQQEREFKGLTQRELADLSGVNYSTITKLESGVYQNPTLDTIMKISSALEIKIESLLQPRKEFGMPSNTMIESHAEVKGVKFTFIDLFAGIGGIRIAFERQGGRSLFSSEIDKYAVKTYQANYGETPAGDITQIDATNIPDHDILLAGFPCQPFSIAGVSKRQSLGRGHGFFDETKGTLFFDIARIIEVKRPKIVFLENVKNLMSHDKGRTFEVIINTLKELDYIPYYKVNDGQHFVPQHRERTIIVAFDNKVFKGKENFEFPELPKKEVRLSDILEKEVDPKYTLTDKLWEYLQNYAKKHKEKGNGFGYGLADFNGITRTLSARYYKDGSEILIPQEGKNPRRLTPRECARLQGFPEDFIIPVSDTQAYKQFGNAVVVPLMEYLANSVVKSLGYVRK
ncbi:MAG: DNA (cytosine-5-)-methyltransferase [Candidatus Dojkabacteria bacterium]|nr:MAG: DNA (cytosine-5-)-methyltransferase [Candidatus Dojkabacteria bacterium]